ncbi:hypothetical protein ACF0H5_021034 [Mactra antiquata]
MRMVNIEFDATQTVTPRPMKDEKERVPQLTTTLTFSDYLCKWCLTYVGQRRQFCSADCAAQFKLCQRRREQKQNLNISVDYYGNVKLSIQGLPIAAGEELPDGHPYTDRPHYGGRRVRRRTRCRNCAKLLSSDSDDEYCDNTCEEMFKDQRRREEFSSNTQQKDAAERRRIRKWLTDAQDQYTKQLGDGIPESARSFGHAPFSFRRIQHIPEETYKLPRDEVVTGGPVTLNPIPLRKELPRKPRTRKMEIDPDKRHLMVDLNWIPKFNL